MMAHQEVNVKNYCLKKFAATKLPTIGIISGAGPEAGILLFEKIIHQLQQNGIWMDKDFPIIHLVNFPFSDMLGENVNKEKIAQQIDSCIQLLSNQCDHIVIACQTLHEFIPVNPESKLIHLFDLMKGVLKGNQKPLVFASKTSSILKLHEKFLNIKCEYFNPEKSQTIINDILKGKKVNLHWLESLANKRMVILGCTEYSVALKNSTINFIDPIRLAAKKIVQLLT